MGIDRLVATLERWLQLAPLDARPAFLVEARTKPAIDAAQAAVDAIMKDLLSRQAELDAGGSAALDFSSYLDAMQGAITSALDRLLALARAGEADFDRVKAVLDRLEEIGLLSNVAYWRAVKQLERAFQDAS